MDEIVKQAVQEALRDRVRLDFWQLVVIVSGTSIASAVATWWAAYSASKGENLATKEDIGEITRRMEEVKLAFDTEREENAQGNRLRLAALDARLRALPGSLRPLASTHGCDTHGQTRRLYP